MRVHTIPRGTRTDVVPWGATDWWNYGGLTGPVWLEASRVTHLVRADVVPHLDAVEVVGARRPDGPPGRQPATGARRHRAADEAGDRSRASIHAASVDPGNLLDPDPRSLGERSESNRC